MTTYSTDQYIALAKRMRRDHRRRVLVIACLFGVGGLALGVILIGLIWAVTR